LKISSVSYKRSLMDLKKVDMQALGSVLSLGNFKGFKISNDDPDDGEVTFYSVEAAPEVCRENYVLKSDGSLTYTRICACMRQSGPSSAFDAHCSGMEYKELDPVNQITAGAILAVLGEKMAGSFVRKYADEIARLRRYLGLAGKRQKLGTGN